MTIIRSTMALAGLPCAAWVVAIIVAFNPSPVSAQRASVMPPEKLKLLPSGSLSPKANSTLQNTTKPNLVNTAPKINTQNQGQLKPQGLGISKPVGSDQNRLQLRSGSEDDLRNKGKGAVQSRADKANVRHTNTKIEANKKKNLGSSSAGRKIDALRDKVGVEGIDAAKGKTVLPTALGTKKGDGGLPKVGGKTPGSAGRAMTLRNPGAKASDGSDPMDQLHVGPHSGEARTFIRAQGGGGAQPAVTTDRDGGGQTSTTVETRWSNGGQDHTVSQSHRDGRAPGGWSHTVISTDEQGQQRYSNDQFGTDGRQTSAERVIYNKDGGVDTIMRGPTSGSMEVVVFRGVATGSSNTEPRSGGNDPNDKPGSPENALSSGGSGNPMTSGTQNTGQPRTNTTSSGTSNTVAPSANSTDPTSSGDTKSSSGTSDSRTSERTASTGDKPQSDKPEDKPDKPDKESQPVEGSASNRNFFGEMGVTNPGDRPKQQARGSDDRNIPNASGVIIRPDSPRSPEEIKAMVTQPGVDGDAARTGSGGNTGPPASRFAQPPSGGAGASAASTTPGTQLTGGNTPSGIINPRGPAEQR